MMMLRAAVLMLSTLILMLAPKVLFASEQTVSASINISISKQPQIRVSDLNDFSIANVSSQNLTESGKFVLQDDICIESNQHAYKVSASSAHGDESGFATRDDSGAMIDYQLAWSANGDAFVNMRNQQLSEEIQLSQEQTSCAEASSKNATLRLSVAHQAYQKANSGTYQDIVTLRFEAL